MRPDQSRCVSEYQSVRSWVSTDHRVVADQRPTWHQVPTQQMPSTGNWTLLKQGRGLPRLARSPHTIHWDNLFVKLR